MSQRNPLPPDILKLTITVPFRISFNVQDLETYLERVSPRVTVDIGSDLSSELSYTSEDLSVGLRTTRSEVSYQRRARKHLREEASEASLRAIADELDREYESEPNGETLGTDDSTRISEGGESDLSFISNSDNFREIVDVENWRARNDAQEIRLLRQQNRALLNATENLANSNRNLVRTTQAISEIIDLTDEPVAEPAWKRTRFE